MASGGVKALAMQAQKPEFTPTAPTEKPQVAMQAWGPSAEDLGSEMGGTLKHTNQPSQSPVASSFIERFCLKETTQRKTEEERRALAHMHTPNTK